MKGDKNKFYKIGFYSILAILVILIAFPLIIPQENSYTVPAAEPQAQLVPYTLKYFLNEVVEDEIVFYVSMANYGYADATNVKVDCDLYKQNDDGSLVDREPDYTASKTFDIIKETSTEEIVVTGLGINKLDLQSSYLGLCKVSSCDDCEVLSQRLMN